MINKLLFGGLLIAGLALVVAPIANNAGAQQRSQTTQVETCSYAQLSITEGTYTWDEGGSQIPRPRTLLQLQRQLGNNDRASLVNLLNAIGGEGWELVSQNDARTVWLFKQ